MAVIVFSDFWHVGVTGGGVEFVEFNHSGRAPEIASRIMVLLGTGSIVFLQDRAGDITSGGPVPANAVINKIPFGRIAMITGETAEDVRRRLIVFTKSPEEGGEVVIPLHQISPEELKRPRHELLVNDSLEQILRLAEEASLAKK